MSKPTDPAIRSGFTKEWVDSLPDLTPDDCRGYMASLEEMPLKTCDATVGCDEFAVWWVYFHGCDCAATCDGHRKLWVFMINEAIAEQGEIPCTQCGKSMSSLPRVMKWRAI